MSWIPSRDEACTATRIIRWMFYLRVKYANYFKCILLRKNECLLTSARYQNILPSSMNAHLGHWPQFQFNFLLFLELDFIQKATYSSSCFLRIINLSQSYCTLNICNSHHYHGCWTCTLALLVSCSINFCKVWLLLLFQLFFCRMYMFQEMGCMHIRQCWFSSHVTSYLKFWNSHTGFCQIVQVIKGDNDVLLKGVGDKSAIEEVKHILDTVFSLPFFHIFL